MGRWPQEDERGETGHVPKQTTPQRPRHVEDWDDDWDEDEDNDEDDEDDDLDF